MDNVIYATFGKNGGRVDKATVAYKLYEEGCRLDEDEATIYQAEEKYERALELNPLFTAVMINLGNMWVRRGFPLEAEKLYLRAIEIDNHSYALYNIGYIIHGRGDLKSAIKYYKSAIAQDENFADAHFNLAVAFEESSSFSNAIKHWKKYLKLDPEGEWAEIARTKVSK